ncbi:MAG: hypothetical protein A2091_01265 [Desulfuromonadales bacterium GWD2_61_12]|nr:MAG: hypothetical protein A2005_04480 [Desulfuromonadales bacterium GWC2_61_20]OGR33932.1 MAG: hypothetical protein A2091_01265 [Desulfuromonadales bacterium GWD2_61_12]
MQDDAGLLRSISCDGHDVAAAPGDVTEENGVVLSLADKDIAAVPGRYGDGRRCREGQKGVGDHFPGKVGAVTADEGGGLIACREEGREGVVEAGTEVAGRLRSAREARKILAKVTFSAGVKEDAVPRCCRHIGNGFAKAALINVRCRFRREGWCQSGLDQSGTRLLGENAEGPGVIAGEGGGTL